MNYEITNDPRMAMVVDNNPASCYFLTMLLRYYGFRVFETKKYNIAIRAFITLKPDLIFLDQKLEVLNGLEVAFFIRHIAGGGAANIYLHTTKKHFELENDPNYKYIDGIINKGTSSNLVDIINQHIKHKSKVANLEKY